MKIDNLLYMRHRPETNPEQGVLVHMAASDYVSITSLLIALVAFIISILDWLQIGREEPWNVDWASDGAVILKRLHYWPVWVENIYNFHGGKVDILNDATHIPYPMRRNSQQLLRIEPVTEGTFLTICYRKVKIAELLRFNLSNFIDILLRKSSGKADCQLKNIQNKIRPMPGKYWDTTQFLGKKTWSTPIVKK